eukprot:g3294.t1
MDNNTFIGLLLMVVGIIDNDMELALSGIICASYYCHQLRSSYAYRKKYVTKGVLKGLRSSQFWYYFNNATDDQLILKYNLNRVALNKLFDIVLPFYNQYRYDPHRSRGAKLVLVLRKRRSKTNNTFNHIVVVCLTIYYLKSQGDINDIAEYFGEPPSCISTNINYGLLLLELALLDNPQAEIRWPTDSELELLAEVTGKKYTDLRKYKIWGFIDGFKSTTMRSKNYFFQNANYSGPELGVPDAPELDAPDAPDSAGPELDAPDVPELDAPDAPELDVPDAPDAPELDAPDALDAPELDAPDALDAPELDAPNAPELDFFINQLI